MMNRSTNPTGQVDVSVTPESLEQAQKLFKVIAEIQRLQERANVADTNAEKYMIKAWKLIEEHTINVKWRDEVVDKLPINVRRLAGDKWKIGVLNNFNATIGRARDTADSVLAGNIYVQCGLYNDALVLYNRSPFSSLLASHLQIFEKNWSFVLTLLNKQFFNTKGQLSNTLLLNLALAYWNIGEYGDCLATLLHLNLEESKKPLDRDAESIWLSHKEVKSMLVVCALLQFNAEMLQYFTTSEPLARYFEILEIIHAFCEIDIETFWALVENNLELPPVSLPNRPLDLLRIKLQQNWLFVHNKMPLDVVLHHFSYGQKNYTALDLVDDLNNWRAPYKVDIVKKTVVFAQTPPDSAKMAHTLVQEFKRNSLILLWNKNIN